MEAISSIQIMICTSFFILGGGIKFIDDAFDEGIFNKKIAMIIAPLLGLLWGYTMYIDKYASTVLFAILLGVFFKGKIDNRAHLFGAIVIILFILSFKIRIDVMYIPLIVLFFSEILDEVGNDFVDKRNYSSNVFYKPLKYFFEYRFMMKVMVIAIVVIGIFPYYIAVAFLLFDGSYHIVDHYGKAKSAHISKEAIA